MRSQQPSAGRGRQAKLPTAAARLRGLKREHACLTLEHERFRGIAHHDPHDGVIDRIGRSERTTRARECAQTITKKNCQLRGYFNEQLGRSFMLRKTDVYNSF